MIWALPIKALLEELDIEFRSLGSTAFKRPTTQGLEPDQCLYIQNEATIRGKKRIDLTVDAYLPKMGKQSRQQ